MMWTTDSYFTGLYTVKFRDDALKKEWLRLDKEIHSAAVPQKAENAGEILI